MAAETIELRSARADLWLAGCQLAEAKKEAERRETASFGCFQAEEVELAKLAVETAMARQYQAQLAVEKAGGEKAGEFPRG
jgi:hypothetical protein